VSGKHPQVPLGESKATGEADVVFPSALTKGTPLGKRKGGPSGDRNGTGNAGHLKSGGGPAPSFSSTSPRKLPVLRSTKVTRSPLTTTLAGSPSGRPSRRSRAVFERLHPLARETFLRQRSEFTGPGVTACCGPAHVLPGRSRSEEPRS